MKLNSNQIEQILPHRWPFLLIDRVEECQPGKFCTGRKCVTASELEFQGHFPGMKVMPGVLILEALAQTGAVALLSEEGQEGRVVLFGGVKNARFRRQVVPGDVLKLHCEIEKRRGPVGFGKAVATVDGETAVTAELSFAITDKPEDSSKS
jgi:3-hydroxyacyl-[acyl-carrier-protein] dehydratase